MTWGTIKMIPFLLINMKDNIIHKDITIRINMNYNLGLIY